MKTQRYPEDARLREAPPNGGVAQPLVRALGWASLLIGLAELLAPARVERAAGIRDRVAAVRGFGARELVTGAGLLTTRRPEPWVWARIAGDCADLAVLATARQRRPGWRLRRNRPDPRLAAFAAVAALTALDLACAEALRQQRRARLHRSRDWGDRSGFPLPADEMRGIAREAGVPADMRYVRRSE